MIIHPARTLLTLTTGFLAALFLLFGTARANEPPTPDPLTVFIQDDFPPFAYVDKTGSHRGFDVELATGLCEHLGVTCRFEFRRFNEIISSIGSDHPADLYVARLWELPEYRRTLAFTGTYCRTRHVFITNDPTITDITPALAPKLKIGTLAGTPYVTDLRNDLTTFGADIQTYPTQSMVFEDLKTGEINVALVDGLSGYHFLMQPENDDLEIIEAYKQVPKNLTSSKIAVRRDLEHLIPVIDDYLLHLVSTGEYQEMSLKYFPFMIY